MRSTICGLTAEIIRLYQSGKSLKAVAKILNTNERSVGRVLKRERVPTRSLSEACRIYSCNFRYFQDITTEPQAYWLGFFAADGHVRPINNTAAILLSQADHSHLEAFKRYLGATHPINKYAAYGGFSDPDNPMRSRIAIQSKEMVNDLIRHGVVPHKSTILQWPTTLPEHLYRHYLRGYSDGNGCFVVSVGRSQVFWSLCSGEMFLKSVREFVTQLLCLPIVVKLQRDSKSEHVKHLRYGGYHRIGQIYELLYRDATVWLPRKRDKIEAHFARFDCPQDKLRRGLSL